MSSQGLRMGRNIPRFWVSWQRNFVCGRIRSRSCILKLRGRKKPSSNRETEFSFWRKKRKDLNRKFDHWWRRKGGRTPRNLRLSKRRSTFFSRNRICSYWRTKRKRRSLNKKRDRWWRRFNKWLKSTRNFNRSFERKSKRIGFPHLRWKNWKEWFDRRNSNLWMFLKMKPSMKRSKLWKSKNTRRSC